MIYSQVRQLRTNKEEAERRKLTYEVLTKETGLAPSTLARLLDFKPIDRIDAKTLDTLCEYFGVGVGDILKFEPGSSASTAREGTREAVAA